MRRWIKRLLIAWLSFLASFAFFATGWVLGRKPSDVRIDRVVAMSWGDGRYGDAFYGAHVYLEPLEENGGYSVRARVYIGRGDYYSSYFHDMGEIGRAETEAEAVRRWGKIIWRESGVYIGTEPRAPFLARAEFENHR